MKPILYIGLAASLALGACSSTYKTAQTPDDVYYSPRQQPQTYAASNGSNGNSVQDEDASYVQGADEEEGNYVTYQDDDQGDYERRINRFGSNGSNYSGDYWDGYNAASNLYLSSGFGYGLGYGGFGLGYSPFSSFYGPSFGLGFGIGGYYSPWSPYYGGWGYPYIGSYWPSYYYPYYGGGYYGGGHGYYYSNTVNRIRTNNMPTAGNGYNNNGGFIGGRTRTGVVANPGGRTTNVGVGNTRRVFAPSAGETSAGYNGRTRTFSQPSYQPVQNRTFSAPTRTFSAPSPSFSAPRSGGGGGGFSGGGRRR